MGPRNFARTRICQWRTQSPCRHWSASSISLSGHNRWSKIRHDKAKNDGQKSKARSILSKDIILASKVGGPDPKLNSQLALAIANAKRGQLAKESIESAIAKGQGKSLSGASLENVTIEAILPNGVAAIIECQTESKAKVLQDMSYWVKKAGGTVTPAAFMFEKIGKISFEKQNKITVDDALEEAVDAGALDITEEDGRLVVDTPPTELSVITRRLEDRFNLKVEKSEIVFIPKEDTAVALTEEQSAEIEKFLENVEDDPAFQNVYINVQ